MNKIKAFSLIELIVVLGIIAVLAALAIPALQVVQDSFNSFGTEGMISSALATARTLALSHQKYVGIRFQKTWKTGDDANTAPQYMFFIIFEESANMINNITDGFRAMKGYKPIKLPKNMGVIDMTEIVPYAPISGASQILDATRFSIVFSPAGKLVIHNVQTAFLEKNKEDEIINEQNVVDAGDAIFVKDDTSENEKSRRCLTIYDAEKLGKLNANERYSNYLKNLKSTHINYYTGEFIK